MFTPFLKSSGEAGGVRDGVPGDVNPPNKFVKFPSKIVIKGNAAPINHQLLSKYDVGVNTSRNSHDESDDLHGEFKGSRISKDSKNTDFHIW